MTHPKLHRANDAPISLDDWGFVEALAEEFMNDFSPRIQEAAEEALKMALESVEGDGSMGIFGYVRGAWGIDDEDDTEDHDPLDIMICAECFQGKKADEEPKWRFPFRDWLMDEAISGDLGYDHPEHTSKLATIQTALRTLADELGEAAAERRNRKPHP